MVNATTSSSGTTTASDHITESLINSLGPVVVIILLGFFCAKVRLLSPEMIPGLNKYVFYISLPALLFRTLYNLDLASLNWKFFPPYIAGTVFVYIVSVSL